MLSATRVHVTPLSEVVCPIVVCHVGCEPPEVPAVVQRWIFPFESTIRLPTVYAVVAAHDGFAVPTAAGNVVPFSGAAAAS